MGPLPPRVCHTLRVISVERPLQPAVRTLSYRISYPSRPINISARYKARLDKKSRSTVGRILRLLRLPHLHFMSHESLHRRTCKTFVSTKSLRRSYYYCISRENIKRDFFSYEARVKEEAYITMLMGSISPPW